MNTAKQVKEMVEAWKAQGNDKAFIVWNAALACVGWPYVYSAWGAECTPAERRKRYRMCPSHETIKTKCKGFDNSICTGCQWFPGGERVLCFDCRGFTDNCLNRVGIDLYGDTCSSQWNHAANWASKGEIATMPKDRLCCLFVKKDGKWNHTGFGLNNETVECSSGVQHFTTRNKKWTHWAVPAGLYDDVIVPADPEPGNVWRPTIRKGSKNQYVTECQTMLTKLGYNLGICGIDGDYGTATAKAVLEFQRDHNLIQDSVCGPMTWDALQKAVDQLKEKPSETTYSVIIRGLDLTQAQALVNNYPGAEIVEGSDSK